MKTVSQYRSLAKAKAAYQGYELEVFKRTLNELASLNINPVTIPRSWNIKHIPNLLRTYIRRHLDEYMMPDTWGLDYCFLQGYNEYVKIFQRSPI